MDLIYQGDDLQPYNVFDFPVSHTRDGPARFLEDFRNPLLADAYGGYDGIVLKQESPRTGCWAHARRKFIDCQAAAPQATQAILRLIKRLFALESKLRDVPPARHQPAGLPHATARQPARHTGRRPRSVAARRLQEAGRRPTTRIPRVLKPCPQTPRGPIARAPFIQRTPLVCIRSANPAAAGSGR